MTKTRDRLITTAAELFYRQGCHATGIDAIIAKAGVAKMTLYKHFSSKDELVAATTRYLDELFHQRYLATLSAPEMLPTQRFLALFDAVAEWTESADFFGCPFVNMTAEFADHANPIHLAAAENKQRMLGMLVEVASAIGVEEPALLARQIQVLLEGSVVLAQVTGDSSFVRDARIAANSLIEMASAGHSKKGP